MTQWVKRAHPATRAKRSTRATRAAVTDRASSSRAPSLPGPVLDRLADGIVIVDAGGRVRFVNQSAREMLALGERSVSGGLATRLLHTVVPGENLFGPARGKKSESETLLLSARGEEIPVRVSVVRLGRGQGVVSVLTDLSKTRRLEQALRRRERLSLIGQLSAGVAHEVRNPLAGISSSAQVLLGRFEPRDERTRFVRAILEEVGRLDRIVTQLLQFARPGEPRLKRGSLGEAVDRLLNSCGNWLADARVHVEKHVATVLPQAWFDPDLIHQVLLNVVNNSVQAMPDGGKLRFEVRSISRRGLPRTAGRRASDLRRNGTARRGPTIQVVQIRIMDTGEGIEKDDLSRLFDPFFTTKPAGTGLGLSICQSIVQEHGGAIQIASRRGQGTTVIIELPVEKRQGERRTT